MAESLRRRDGGLRVAVWRVDGVSVETPQPRGSQSSASTPSSRLPTCTQPAAMQLRHLGDEVQSQPGALAPLAGRGSSRSVR